MKTIYLVTGASGHLGSTLIRQLLEFNKPIRALVLPGEEEFIPKEVTCYSGNVCDRESLKPFFAHEDDEELILFHCAGIVTISSSFDPNVWKVNVEGTRNILEMAQEYKVRKMIYVSSVHALIEKESGDTAEAEVFEPDKIEDQYGKSKAAAAALCQQFAKEGLDVSIVHPSGIYGPGDIRKNNHSVRSVELMAKGLIPLSMEGGFDFVDVRDAARGMIQCAGKGRRGECYILSGHFVTTTELINGVRKLCGYKPVKLEFPYSFVKHFAPFLEKGSHLLGNKKPLVTPYSLAILNTNGHFTHAKASKEFDYSARSVEESLRDMIEEFGIRV